MPFIYQLYSRAFINYSSFLALGTKNSLHQIIDPDSKLHEKYISLHIFKNRGENIN